MPIVPTHAPSLRLARRAAALQPSATLAMVGRVRKLQAQGVEILNLTAGEPDFTPPPVVEESGIQAIRQGKGRYTAAAGTPELRAAAAQWIQAEVGLPYSPDEVVVTPGAKLAISQALLALVDPGERVVIPIPSWNSYVEMVRLCEGEPVLVPCGPDGYPQVEALEAASQDGAVALLLNTPCNPTGAVYPESLLREIGAWALEREIWVISDEIYAALTYDGTRHVSPLRAAPGLREQGVWIGGVSKAYSMTGWRIGFLAAPRPLATAVADIQSQLVSSPNGISQVAALEAIRQGGADRERMRQSFERRARLVVAALKAIPGLECPVPRGAFYAFPRLRNFLGKTDPATGRTIRSGDDFVEVLLEADRVATVGGSAFGDPQAFRLSFAASEDTLHEALRRLAARLQALR